MSERWNGTTQSSITPVTYKSNTGYQMTAVAQTADLAPDNIDIQGVYQTSGISKADLLSGVYDGSSVYIFLTSYEAPVEDEHMLKKAVYGIQTANDETFKIEYRGLSQILNQNTGRTITILSGRDLEAEGVPLSAPDWSSSTAYANVKATYDWRPNGTQANVVKPTTPNGFW